MIFFLRVMVMGMVEAAPVRWVSVHDGDKAMPHFSSVLLIDVSSVHFSLVESHMSWCTEKQYFYQSSLFHSCATLRFIDTVVDIEAYICKMANILENVVILVFFASGPIYITRTVFIIEVNYWECSNIFPFIAV